MKISYLSTAAAVLALALTQTSGAATLNLTNSNTSTTEAWTITSNITVDGQGNVSLTATPPGGGSCTNAGTLGFSGATYSVAEGGSINISVTRSVCGVGDVTVSYGTSDGTAGAGDYSTASGILSWANGVMGTKTFSVATQGEPIPVTEPNKTVNLALSGITGGATQGTAAATLTITDVAPSAGIDPTCPASPSGLLVRDDSQNTGTKKNYYNKANEASAIRFTAGSNLYGSVGWFIDTGLYLVNQQISVSRCRGDFTKTYPCGSTNSQGVLYTTSGTTKYCPLAAGQTYYVNIRNSVTSTGADSCPSGKLCGLLLELK